MSIELAVPPAARGTAQTGAEGARSGPAVEYLKGMVSVGDATALAAGWCPLPLRGAWS